MSSTQQLLLGEGAGVAAPVYIEDVFSTWLYTGNGSTQTITNGIDLSTKGGLVWIKRRNGVYNHVLYDTSRGVNLSLSSNTTGANVNQAPDGVSAFNTTGFSLNGNSHLDNNTTGTYASWTFREQPKFFDIVTYTGTNGVRTINHNLGSAAGCIMIKCTSTTSNWMVWHTSISGQNNLYLNATDGTSTVAADPISVDGWPSSTSTTTFTVDSGTDSCNTLGETYVAYLFASNAGGFGLTGSDNVISCGSFTTDGSGNFSVNLGYEPQWVLIKSTDFVDSWYLIDVMRGMSQTNTNTLRPNTSGAESAYAQGYCTPTATGFTATTPGLFTASKNFIYIAIRRGPMKVPTLGTSVFVAETYSGNDTLNREFSVAPVQYSDLSWFISRNYPTVPVSISFVDRLRGSLPKLWTGGTSSESTSQASVSFGNKMEAIVIATTGNFSGLNESGTSLVMYNLKRSPSFFDEVCYTGAGSGTTVSHNLAAAPDLIITKRRDSTSDWGAFHTFTSTQNGYNYLNLTNAGFNATYGTSSRAFQSQPTSTQFVTGGQAQIDTSGGTYVAYLFATCAGVSKVGSYSGNTSNIVTVNCGFTAGARFVLIKRTDSTGDWYVWDSARGITSGNDPYLLINSTAAEVTGTNYVDTDTTGFKVTAAAPAALNASGGTYIFLAIA